METIEIKLDPKWKEEREIEVRIQTAQYHWHCPEITAKQLIDLHDATGKLLAQKYRGSKRAYDPEPNFSLICGKCKGSLKVHWSKDQFDAFYYCPKCVDMKYNEDGEAVEPIK